MCMVRYSPLFRKTDTPSGKKRLTHFHFCHTCHNHTRQGGVAHCPGWYRFCSSSRGWDSLCVWVWVHVHGVSFFDMSGIIDQCFEQTRFSRLRIYLCARALHLCVFLSMFVVLCNCVSRTCRLVHEHSSSH